MEQLLFVFAVTFLSAVVQMVTGFGFSVVMMALLPLAIPFDLGLYLSTIGGFLMSIWLVWKYRQWLEWKKAILPLAFSVVGNIVGLLLNGGNGDRRLLGVFLVFLAIWFLMFASRIQIPGTPLTGAVVGVVAGACHALFAMCGPPMVLYFASVIRGKEAYISTINFALAGSSLITVVLRTVIVGAPQDLGINLLPCAVAMVVGGWLGKLGFDRVNAEQMKKIIYLFMCVVGVYFVLAG